MVHFNIEQFYNTHLHQVLTLGKFEVYEGLQFEDSITQAQLTKMVM